MRTSLLFLADNILDVPSFDSHKSGCEITIAANSHHAVQAVSERTFESVIADHKFQSNNEMPLFSRVANRSPNTTRILLCQATNPDPIETDISAHLHLNKPCNAQSVIEGVQKARVVAQWLRRSEVQCLLSRMQDLPPLPSIYYRLCKLLSTTDVDRSAVGDVLAEDPGICNNIIQVVNSGLVGPDRHADNPYDAVSLLGNERTKALALFAHTFSHYSLSPDSALSPRKLWDHSLAAASLAQMITREEAGGKDPAEIAFAGGLLHDLGKLILAANLPSEYRDVVTKATSEKLPLHVAETAILGTDHAQIAACILGTWGVPSDIVASVGFHHAPSQLETEDFTPATGVHLANVFEREICAEKDTLPHPIDPEHLEKVGMSSRLLVWREILGSTVTQTAA